MLVGEGVGVLSELSWLLEGEAADEAPSSLVDDEQSMNFQDMLYTPP